MGQLLEMYGAAKKKFFENKRGAGIAMGYTFLSNLLIPGQAIFTAGLLKIVDSNTISTPWLLGGLATLNVASVIAETTILSKRNIGNSIPSATANFFAKEFLKFINVAKDYPILAAAFASLATHAWRIVALSILNPRMDDNLSGLMMGDGGKEFFNNFVSISSIATLWNLFTYYTIYNGTADRITNKVNSTSKKVKDRTIDLLRSYAEV